MAAAVLAHLLALYLVVAAPLLGRRRAARLKTALAARPVDPNARLAFYWRTIARQWATLPAVALIGLLGDRDRHDILLQAPTRISGIHGILLVLIIVTTALLAHLIRRDPDNRAAARDIMGGAALLFPQTARERKVFLAVSATAGICEEVLYRGFFLAYLGWLFPAWSTSQILLAGAIAFGLAHLYQGPKGMAFTGIFGWVIGKAAIDAASLVVPIVLHALVDARWSMMPSLEESPSGAGS
ncbi:MAG: CPBP family intramembrane glutamic endopeptidase [Acidimicrobiia bacterium]